MNQDLFCDKTNTPLTGPDKCIECTERQKNITKKYISCSHVKRVDNPSINTIFPIDELYTAAVIDVDKEAAKKYDKDAVKEEKVITKAEAKVKVDEVKAKEEIDRVVEDGEKSVWDDSIVITRNPVFQLPKKAYLIEVKD